MEKKKIHELIAKYAEGVADPSELVLIENLIAEGKISLTDFPELMELENQLHRTEEPQPSPELDHRFYEMLAQVKSSGRKVITLSDLFSFSRIAPALALASLTLIIGFFLGALVNSQRASISEDHTEELSREVADLKEMMMLALLEKESASERLKAVSLVQDMDDTNSKVIKALLRTLNEDENINVRLAALDALRPYTASSSVREGIIQSIGKQHSPLIQMAMAELMASIHEKSSVRELQKIIENKDTPEEVKKRIQESIGTLI